MPQLNFTIPAHLLDRIDAAKPDFLDRKGFICLLLANAIDTGPKLPAYRVGAGNTGHTATETDSAPLPQQSWVEDRLSPEQTFTDLPSQIDLGKGVGREFEGTPRKGPKEVSGNLLAHDDLIRDFWRVKGGSKGDRAWSLLLTELGKIQDLHGDAVVRQQLELAINGKWKGVTLANLERFDAPGGQRGQTGSAAPKTPQQLIVESVIRKHQAMEGNRAPF